jgi:hypothetical protein
VDEFFEIGDIYVRPELRNAAAYVSIGIRLRFNSRSDFDHWHLRRSSQEFRQIAGVMRIKVLHNYKGHPASRLQVFQQLACRFVSASRTADTNNRAA